MEFDELHLLQGRGYPVNDKLFIRNPTLREICDYGEQEYYSMVSRLAATPADYKVQLDDMGIDYETLDEFHFFVMLTRGITAGQSGILLSGVDLAAMEIGSIGETGEPCLYDETGLTIDRVTAQIIAEYIRKLHGLKKNMEIAGNAITKQVMIDEDRRRQERHQDEAYKSVLAPLISALTNCGEFKYDHESVWDLPIYVFMDSVKRIQKIKRSSNLTASMYSGLIDGSKISNKDLNWLGEL